MPAQRFNNLATQPSIFHQTYSAIRGRTTGPGGLYNVGNLIALIGGFVVFNLSNGAEQYGTSVLWAYLFRNVATSCLTLAMVIFLLSGEAYHRGFSGAANKKQYYIWVGDFLAGLAGVVLTMALVQFGETRFAIAAGLLLSVGKFGSVIYPEGSGNNAAPANLPYVFRLMVVASRVPSLIAVGITLFIFALGGGSTFDTALALIMLICYSLWLVADYLLISDPGES